MATLYNTSTQDPSRFLTPGGLGGTLNVLQEFDWTLSRKAARTEVVPCYLWEYQPNNAQLINSLVYWFYQIFGSTSAPSQSLAIASQNINNTSFSFGGNSISPNLNTFSVNDPLKDPMDVYKFRYVGTPTGFSYVLPYLGSAKFSVDNTFTKDEIPWLADIMNSYKYIGSFGLGTMKNSLVDEIMRVIGGGKFVKGLINSVTGYKINTIATESWDSTSPESITISFDLLNTNSFEQAKYNYELCYLLNYQNHPAQRNAFLVQSPCIYTLMIPSTMYMPVCYMKNFKVMNLGQNRMIGGVAMPEAYRLELNFVGILNPPSRNMLTYIDSNPAELPKIEDENNAASFIKNRINSFKDTGVIQPLFKTIGDQFKTFISQ